MVQIYSGKVFLYHATVSCKGPIIIKLLICLVGNVHVLRRSSMLNTKIDIATIKKGGGVGVCFIEMKSVVHNELSWNEKV